MWLVIAAAKAAIGHLLAWVIRKPYWAMHPDMNLEAMAEGNRAVVARLHELEGIILARLREGDSGSQDL